MAASIELRGRCRCGEVLSFTLTPAGYKRVCPRCRSVVRLNPKQRESKRRRRGASAPAGNGAVRCSCGQEILLADQAAPLVVCPACHQAVALERGGHGRKRPKDAATRKTVELSPRELQELAQELSTAVPPGAGGQATSRKGWEQGLRVCRDCGELLGMGVSVCRHCGTANG